jgi:Ca2+-binding RTX toxin-like protein
MATNFTVNKSDLEFILKQIKIGENTSIGYTPAPVSIQQAIRDAYGLSTADAALAPFGLRTVDGTFNNLLPGQTNFGAADTLFPRLTNPVFRNDADGDQISLGPNVITNTNYGSIRQSVADADPRIISNLIVDQSVNNPAAIYTFLNNPLSVAAFEEAKGFFPDESWFTNPANAVEANKLLQTIPNQSPDIGLSPSFNSWMTIFGQFFDHGLDLVTKGNAGTVYIPLQADDPLIAGADGILGNTDDLPPQLRFMALTRATPTIVNGVPQHTNTTTAFIDQNQTYTSHASHQVFLREYVKDINGRAVSTGKLLDGTTASGSATGAVGNWGEVKAQAKEMLGIILTDFNVHNVPLLLTDQYGKFIPGDNGYAQVATATGFVEGTAAGLVLPSNTVFTNHAFLDDIAHHASPRVVDVDANGIRDGIVSTIQVADADIDTNRNGIYDAGDILTDVNGDGFITTADFYADDRSELTYDDEMLNAHFVTGDGRGNENIALTAVHSVFHSEHNRVVDANKITILQSGDLAFLNEWLLNDVASLPTIPPNATEAQLQAIANTLTWDGERLFQAARFSTEMQYQHLVFEEFARRIQPMIDPFVFNNSPNIDPSITAEFAHTVYRFGHSMLTGTVDRLDNNLDLLNGDLDQKTLLAAFLNPQAYVGSGATLEEINANLIRGLTRDVGNAIDEFIVTDVRNNLLGLPLDLGALNIARGRDTGVPTLNETRSQLYNSTGLADLKPYTSWYDFALNIKNAASIVNFIAAYGTHGTITAQTTLAGKRAAAEAIVFGGTGAPSDRFEFLNATGVYASNLGGLNDVDLWVGGLAEANPEFGGMLGTTFNFVFEVQMEKLQNGDRLYYLSRTQGTNLLNQLEPNTFTDLVMRNTALGDKYSTHLSGSLFITPDHIIELDRGIAQADYNGTAPGNDPIWSNPFLGAKVVRDYTGSSKVDGNHDFGGTLRFIGGEHVVLGGTEGNDKIYGDKGDDTLWGDGGNDYLNGGTAADNVFGGEGDDIIEDPFGDDVLRGNQGNDVITSARGLDLIFGEQGSDYIVLGQDASEAFGGTESDFILGGEGSDFLLGNEGDDWIEGAGGFDTLAGDNSELFFNSPIIGHDVLFGHGDETDYDAESGDDIMGSGPSVFRYEGMFGFDWGIAKNDLAGVQFDLGIPFFTTDAADILRDRFDNVEALSGWQYNDILDGDNRGHVLDTAPAPLSFDPLTADPLFFEVGTNGDVLIDNLLRQDGVNRIAGFNAWFGNARQTLFGSNTADFRDGNILMGGDGSDFLQGRGGFDLIDGDAWLNVRIKIVVNGATYSAESMSTDTTVAGPYAGKVFETDANGNPIFTSLAFGGRSLTSLMLDRTINPSQLSIVREIKYDDTNVTGANQNIDTAVFQGVLAEYEIEGFNRVGRAFDVNGDGFIYVRDLDNGATRRNALGSPIFDDTDLIKNIERLQFSDQTIRLDVTLPSAIEWTGITPANLELPTAGATIATLTTTDDDTTSGFVYSLAAGSSAGFAVSSTGVVTTTANLAVNQIYTLNISSRDTTGATRTESFVIRTGGNSGRGDTITANNLDTVIYGHGRGDTLNGLGGNDNLFGQTGADTLNGGAGNDILVGGTGADIVNGGTGNDTLRYTVDTDGNDTVNGGADSDTLVLTSNGGDETLTVTYNGTSITNFEGGTVTNVESVTANLGAGIDTLTYTAPGGVTVNLATGTASGFTTIANIENVTGGTGDDTLTGNTFANVLSGGGGSDTLIATVDNVRDTLDGDGGNDTANYSAYTTALTVNLGSAAPIVVTGSGTTAANSDVLVAIENFIGGAGSNNLTGNGAANSLTGGASNDIFNGGDGNDILNGLGGNDTFTYTMGDGADAINGGTHTTGDTLNIGVTGAAANDILDVIYNGTSLTQFEDGIISNVEFVNANLNGGNDTLSYAGSTSGVTVNLGTNTASGFNSIASIENVTGGAAADTLVGSAVANVINGGAGTDLLTGGAGGDTFIFQFGQSGVGSPDRITDFAIGTDRIDLLSAAGGNLGTPTVFTRAANFAANALTTLNNIVAAVFTDANGATAGNQGLGNNAAALVQVTGSGSTVGTYLVVNNGAGFQAGTDLVINITGHTGTLPGLGGSAASNFFV